MDFGKDDLFSLDIDCHEYDCSVCHDQFSNVSDFKLRIDYNKNFRDVWKAEPDEAEEKLFDEIIDRDKAIICGDCLMSFILKQTDFLKYLKLTYFSDLVNDKRE